MVGSGPERTGRVPDTCHGYSRVSLCFANQILTEGPLEKLLRFEDPLQLVEVTRLLQGTRQLTVSELEVC